MLRRATTLLLAAAVVVVPAADAQRTPGPALSTLLVRHVPVLVLHPAERFRPVPVDGFLADSDVQRMTVNGWEDVGGPLPAGGAQLRLDHRSCRAAEGLASIECYAAAQAVHPSPPLVYGAAFRRGTHVALQYWLWYPFNPYSPTVAAGDVWQVHEGDWESVSVILDLEGRPLLVGLSRHCAGARREWREVQRRRQRPLVHVALGSHANYFGPGIFRHDPQCWPRELRDVVRAFGLVDRTARGSEVQPRLVVLRLRRHGWMRFAGTWGEDGYVHFPNNEPIAYRGSPRGPTRHEQWRKPISEVLSWPRG